ncbi:unnamed protein product [Phytophthora lilii]|uniref:Unnamed protein product n=1 Tax=Phytophthora lilii TaxID=2077276 RepID=A0A9W6X7K0_9STRA|nr:unnamed protein product [Phytophthora lilii]
MKLVSLFLAAVLAPPALAERNTLCDDGGPLSISCDVKLDHTLSDAMCGLNGVVALQAGCFLCVDATTCLGLDGQLMLDAKQQDNTLPLPTANGNDISVLLQDQADHTPEEAAYEQAAAAANLAGASPQAEGVAEEVAKPPEVSNWLFSIPVCLAIVSLGLAIRARVPARRRGFQKLQETRQQDTSPLFGEDINPFCSTDTSDEDFAIETAGHFQGDPSNSESEEAQFLSSAELEEDAFTKAESEAIKQAVLLHIKEFDEEEDDEEVEI